MPDDAGSRLDHLNLAVPNLRRSLAFYEPVLAAIGIEKVLIANGQVGTNMHLAFTTETRDQVHRFYDAALAAGARALHPPAIHPEYHPNYFGALVADLDGINLEAVCHQPPTPIE